MTQRTRHRGFTLLEVIIGMAVIVILVVIAVPSLAGITEKARVTADLADLSALNRATAAYAELNNTSGDAFPGISADEARMQALVDARLLTDTVAPQTPGTQFHWDAGTQRWTYSGSAES